MQYTSFQGPITKEFSTFLEPLDNETRNFAIMFITQRKFNVQIKIFYLNPEDTNAYDIYFEKVKESNFQSSELNQISIFYDKTTQTFSHQKEQKAPPSEDSLLYSLIKNINKYVEGNSKTDFIIQLASYYRNFKKVIDEEIQKIKVDLRVDSFNTNLSIIELKDIIQKLSENSELNELNLLEDFMEQFEKYQKKENGTIELEQFQKIINCNIIPEYLLNEIDFEFKSLLNLEKQKDIEQISDTEYFYIHKKPQIMNPKFCHLFTEYFNPDESIFQKYFKKPNLKVALQQLVNIQEILEDQEQIKDCKYINELIRLTDSQEARDFCSQVKQLTKKDVISVFMGKSKAGKSTIINGLNGVQLVQYIENDIIKIKCKNQGQDQDLPKIGNELSSCTKQPKLCKKKGTDNEYFCDSAGLEDNTSNFVQPCNAIILKHLFSSEAQIKLVYVIDGASFGTSSANIDFSNEYTLLESLIGKDKLNDIERNQQQKKQLCFLINKVTPQTYTNFQKINPKKLKHESQNFMKLIKKDHNILPVYLYGEGQNLNQISHFIHGFNVQQNLNPAIANHESSSFQKFYQRICTKMLDIQKLMMRKISKQNKLQVQSQEENQQNNNQQIGMRLQQVTNFIKTYKEYNYIMRQFIEYWQGDNPDHLDFQSKFDDMINQDNQVQQQFQNEYKETKTKLSLLFTLFKPLITKETNKSVVSEQVIYWKEVQEVLFETNQQQFSDLNKEIFDSIHTGIMNKVIEIKEKEQSSISREQFNGICDDQLNEYQLFKDTIIKIYNNEIIYESKNILFPQSEYLEQQIKIFQEYRDINIQAKVEQQYEKLYNILCERMNNVISRIKFLVYLSGEKREKEMNQLDKNLQNQIQEIQSQKQSLLERSILKIIRNAHKLLPASIKIEKLCMNERVLLQFILKKFGENGKNTAKYFIPFVGSIYGSGQMLYNIFKGNGKRALINFLSSTSALIPGYGSITSLGLDVIEALVEIYDDNQEVIQKRQQLDDLLGCHFPIPKQKYCAHALNGLKKQQFKKCKLILSIDGGGIRGIIPALIIQHINNNIDEDLQQITDLFVGTSTGAIVAAFLALPALTENSQQMQFPKYSTQQIIDLYKEAQNLIFQKRSFPNQLYSSKYMNDGLNEIAQYYFDQIKILEVPKLFVTAAEECEFTKFKKHFFSNNQDSDVLVKDALIASCSAPTFFPSYEIGNKKYRDGGIFLNNPAFFAYKKYIEQQQGEENQKIILISIGTGKEPYNNNSREDILFWAKNYSEISIEEQMEDAHQQLLREQQKINSRLSKYFRIQVPLKRKIKLDDASFDSLIELVKDTQQYLNSQEGNQIVRELVNQLKQISY